jgi:hypothetical protein
VDMPVAPARSGKSLVVAKNGVSCQAAPLRMIATSPGPCGKAPARCSRPCAPGLPPYAGVIVLTVKLFGESLEAPRTLAVWQYEPQ